MEKCCKCERDDDKVRLLDAVYGNEIVKICEECSVSENIPIIRKPSSLQLNQAEKPYTVRERLRRMAGLPQEKGQQEVKKAIGKLDNITIDSLRKPKEYREVLDEKYKLARKRNIPLNLIDNFNWLIMMERKKRKMSRHQLAGMIGENEIALKMIENKEFPDDALVIINKIEQFLGIKLRKQEKTWEMRERLKEQVKEGLKFPEEVKVKKEQPAVVLKFDPDTAKKLTIDDLRRMKEAREKTQVENIVWKKQQEKSEKKKEEAVKREEITAREAEESLVGSDIEIEED